jgi:hypothetical protein
MISGRPQRLDVDEFQTVRQLDVDSRIAIGYVAAQLACVIEANYPALGQVRIENIAIEFAYRLHLAQRDH